MKRRLEITVETDRVLVLTRCRGDLVEWCAGCRQETVMLTPEEAAALVRLPRQHIRLGIEAGRLHFAVQPDGLQLVCLTSLLN